MQDASSLRQSDITKNNPLCSVRSTDNSPQKFLWEFSKYDTYCKFQHRSRSSQFPGNNKALIALPL